MKAGFIFRTCDIKFFVHLLVFTCFTRLLWRSENILITALLVPQPAFKTLSPKGWSFHFLKNTQVANSYKAANLVRSNDAAFLAGLRLALRFEQVPVYGYISVIFTYLYSYKTTWMVQSAGKSEFSVVYFRVRRSYLTTIALCDSRVLGICATFLVVFKLHRKIL